MRKLRTAVVGLGRIGWQYHIPQILSHDGFSLEGVVDLDQNRLDEAREQYGVQGFQELSQMLDCIHPELTVIASPTHLHRDHAVLAMEKGSDVFLDKPMARDLREAEEIAAAMERTGRRLMVYQPHRGVPEVAVLRRILNKGILGRIYMFKRAATNYCRRSDWQAMKKFGGGMLNNYGAHYIDQLFYLTGSCRPQSLYCYTDKIATLGDADDVVKAVIRTDAGVLLDLDINMASAQEMTPWMVLGSHGSVQLETDGDGGRFFRAKYCIPEELSELTLSEDTAAKDRLYNSDQPIPWHVEDFPVTQEDQVSFYDKCYSYFALDEAPFVPVQETLQLMDTIRLCRESAEGAAALRQK